MSRPIVLDASVAVALVRREAESARWRALAAEWTRAGRPIVVPAHFWSEIANTLIARHRFGGAGTVEAIHRLDEVVADTVAVDRPILLLAIDLAERHRLSIHDAAYLAVAEAVDGELATTDRALEVAGAERLVDRTRPGRHRLSEGRAPYGPPTRPTWPDYSGAASYLASLRADLKRRQAAARRS